MTKILVIGAGAIGGLYGGKLAQAGAEVSVVCRSDYEVVKKNGIHVKSCWGDFHFTPHQVLRDVSEYHDDADFILITTKVLPEVDDVALIKPVLRQNSAIVVLQNGIHIEKRIATAFPKHKIISAIAFVCVYRTAHGAVTHQDYGRLIIGDFPHKISEKSIELVELWNKSGVPCEAVDNIRAERWKKLAWNAAFNPVSVLAGGVDTKRILDHAPTRNLVENIMKEVCMLAEIDGCKLPENVIEKSIEITKDMKPYKTSMLLDFESKRKMEIEAILGNAVRFAKEKNVATPYLSSLYGLLSCY